MDPKRVAARFQQIRQIKAKGLSQGGRFQNEKIRVRRLADYIEVTDLTNAGKRGKKCSQFITHATYSFGDTTARNEWLERISDMFLDFVTISNPYERMLAIIRDIREDGREDEIRLIERDLKGIEVEPFGIIFDLTIPRKDGKSELIVHCSPTDFYVKDHAWIDRESRGGGMYHDTTYHPDKRKDAILFYGWMKDNSDKVKSYESVQDFRNLWTVLGVKYDYQ